MNWLADLRPAYRWLTPCDTCVPSRCTCAADNPRPIVWQLLQEIEDWREMHAAGRLPPPSPAAESGPHIPAQLTEENRP